MIARGILDWVDNPSSSSALGFMGRDGGWEQVVYSELAQRVRAAGAEIAQEDLGSAPVVILLQNTGPDFVSSFFGALMAGAAVTPLAPPTGLGSQQSWMDHARNVIAAAGADLVLADENLAAPAREAVAAAGLNTRVSTLSGSRADQLKAAIPGWEVALLQFTSGSRGLPPICTAGISSAGR